MREYVVFDDHFLVRLVAVEYVGNDIRKIGLREHFFLVAKFDDALGNFFEIGVIELYAQLLQVVFNIGLSAGFAERIFALASKAFGDKVAEI